MEPMERTTFYRNCRMDFTMEVVGKDDETGITHVTIVPDRRRYDEPIQRDGKIFYLDKYLRFLIPIEEMARQMGGLPIFALSPTIESTPEYATRRRPEIASDLRTEQYTPPAERAIPHKSFEDDPRPRDTVFLSIDVCGSSAQRYADPKAFDRSYEILFRELGIVVGQFNGAILTMAGDGFIALVDHPAFTSQCDAAIDMGLSLLVVLGDAINPALKHIGLNPLKIRIGADYGPAETRHREVPATGFSRQEVVSDALNRAVKIEKSCGDNESRIGRRLYELIHVQWLERAKEVSLDGTNVGISDYKAYRIT
jgi:class 3 adenylate cyclase